MSDALQIFAMFALVAFGASCIYAAYRFGSEVVAALYYRGIREELRNAISEVESRWNGEPVPPETVVEILVLIHNRRMLDWDELRKRQGGGA